MRTEIDLTDAQIEAAFDEMGACANLDEEYKVNVVFTRETLADVMAASASWFDSKKPREEQTEDGFSALCIDAAQVKKGDTRRDVVVIDFGTVRAAVY